MPLPVGAYAPPLPPLPLACRYAGGDSRHNASSADAALMGIDEWREFIVDLALLDDAFTQVVMPPSL